MNDNINININIKKKCIGVAMCGSFCTFDTIFPQMENLCSEGFDVIPIMSANAYSTNTRFGEAESHIMRLKEITGVNVLHNIWDVEPIGPKKILDALLIAPCTGNTIAKIANSITDTSVTMAAKAHLRNQRPLVIFISTNDALGINARNIGILFSTKNVYFVPFAQDDPIKKPTSLISKPELILPAIEAALDERQLQPVILGSN